MNERFAELMAMGQAGLLTAAESEELACLLNAPVLDPLANPLPGFVSKRSFDPSDIPARLRKIDWFSRSGEPMALDLSMPIEPVAGWPEALARCADGVWENVELEAQNQLTLWLHKHDRQRYGRWNDLVVGFKAAVVNPLTEEKWEPYRRRHGLDLVVVHSVQWDVIGALMADAYLSSGHRCFFFLELLAVYEAGRRRSVQMEVEVSGTPEEVWQAIATGPGISSWFVPTELEVRDGKPVAMKFNFGPGMEPRSAVTAWDPPRMFATEAESFVPGSPPIANEWSVEARGGGVCILRIVQSLFASTDDWDNQLLGAKGGLASFLSILRIYLTHFRGQRSAMMKWMAPFAGTEAAKLDHQPFDVLANPYQ